MITISTWIEKTSSKHPCFEINCHGADMGTEEWMVESCSVVSNKSQPCLFKDVWFDGTPCYLSSATASGDVHWDFLARGHWFFWAKSVSVLSKRKYKISKRLYHFTNYFYPYRHVCTYKSDFTVIPNGLITESIPGMFVLIIMYFCTVNPMKWTNFVRILLCLLLISSLPRGKNLWIFSLFLIKHPIPFHISFSRLVFSLNLIRVPVPYSCFQFNCQVNRATRINHDNITVDKCSVCECTSNQKHIFPFVELFCNNAPTQPTFLFWKYYCMYYCYKILLLLLLLYYVVETW